VPRSTTSGSGALRWGLTGVVVRLGEVRIVIGASTSLLDPDDTIRPASIVEPDRYEWGGVRIARSGR
jgi:hypothetical protein